MGERATLCAEGVYPPWRREGGIYRVYYLPTMVPYTTPRVYTTLYTPGYTQHATVLTVLAATCTLLY